MCVVHDLGSLEDAPEVIAELYTDDIRKKQALFCTYADDMVAPVLSAIKLARQAEEIEAFVN